MTRCVVGVIGHVDHGKTALVRALTGVDTDRLPEEKRRGISIALGFAHIWDGDRIVDLIDTPGHERFVATMISGATGMDGVLLVVAGNEGVMAQTEEHADIAGLVGVHSAIVAVTKADQTSSEAAAQVGAEAERLLRLRGIETAAVIVTSALRNEGIEALRKALLCFEAGAQPRPVAGHAYLPIDRAFSMSGHGPVVTGTLRGAAIVSGDVLELWPPRRKVRVRGLQVHSERVTVAAPGQRVAVNLRDVDAAELKRGMVLAAPNTLALSEWLTISINVLPSAPPLRNGARLRASLGAEEVDVRLRLLDGDVLAPGAHGFAQLRCATPLAAPVREAVVLRVASPARTVAGGRILDPCAVRERRHDQRLLQRLAEYASLSPEALVAAEIERAGANGVPLRRLRQLTGLADRELTEALRDGAVELAQGEVAIARAALDALQARILDMLKVSAEGRSHSDISASIDGAGVAALDEALARLMGRGEVVKRGARFMVAQPEQDVARARSEARLSARISEMLRLAGLSPPNPSEIIVDAPTKRAVDRLLREGVIIRALDRAKGREMLFHRDAIDAAKRTLAPLLVRVPGLLVTEIGAALGVSRKYTMPLIDHLDAIKFTQRIQDRRVLAMRATSAR